jgi:suppressor for copper-sensitivity B
MSAMFKYLVLFLVLFASPAFANSDWVMTDNIQARIVDEDGKFGVEIVPAERWHIYYKDAGDAGLPTIFDWEGSKNFKVDDILYPKYKVFDEEGIKTKGYDSKAFFTVGAKIGEDALINLKISGAVCSDICMPFELKIQYEPEPNIEDNESVTIGILLTALLAGLLLNVMPCVLPVLSLKILSVAKQAGKELAHARMNFFFTALGIITTFLILAGLAIFVRQAGMQIGWGLHFQSPYFVGVLMAITFLFSLSLFGFFHLNPPSWLIGSGAHKDSLAGNFISGMLATFLGTACTAPVVVTAVGFALANNDAVIITMFALMGIGMALPFLILSAFPKLANYLPKPGAWMNKVKFFMGILLLGTSVWLGSILYVQVIDKMSGGKEWHVLNESKITKFVNEGGVVFVDVTAQWCVNCKTNEARVLNTDEMQQYFKDNHVILMKGDMTSPSKPLLEYIKKFGRYGIPVNIVYGPKAKDGILLDTLLSIDAVKEAVEKAK